VEPVHLDKASLDRLIAVGDGAAVGASAPRADVYEGLNSPAAFFETNILIVETWPEQETAWIKAIPKAKVNLPLIVCIVQATQQ
jgi:hypothetical protein